MRWMAYSVPLQGLLLLSQLITGLNNEAIDHDLYTLIHVGGGSLLVGLVMVHVIVNWDWIQRTYGARHPTPPPPPADDEG